MFFSLLALKVSLIRFQALYENDSVFNLFLGHKSKICEDLWIIFIPVLIYFLIWVYNSIYSIYFDISFYKKVLDSITYLRIFMSWPVDDNYLEISWQLFHPSDESHPRFKIVFYAEWFLTPKRGFTKVSEDALECKNQ